VASDTAEDKAMGTSTTETRLLLTVAEAAKALAVSTRTIWSLTNRGELPAVRIGRAVRYEIGDLRAWIDRRKSGGVA
jgi:excisionase family DNA binding protein